MDSQFEKEIRTDFPGSLTWQKTIPTFHPINSSEAAQLFQRARQKKQHLFISGYGNSINPVGDKFADLIIIKTDRLNSIIEVSEKDLFMTVGAGYPLKEINKILAPKKMWFPFGDTNFPGSFGGAIASGLTATAGEHEVPFSRSLLDLTAVLPDGSIVKPGAKTFKSVSGYDISRLFFNSWGSLGLVIQLSFRVQPLNLKDQATHLKINQLDYDGFKAELTRNDSEPTMAQKIKQEFDPENILPIL